MIKPFFFSILLILIVSVGCGQPTLPPVSTDEADADQGPPTAGKARIQIENECIRLSSLDRQEFSITCYCSGRPLPLIQSNRTFHLTDIVRIGGSKTVRLDGDDVIWEGENYVLGTDSFTVSNNGDTLLLESVLPGCFSHLIGDLSRNRTSQGVEDKVSDSLMVVMEYRGL